jgi:hypothetical protein
MSALAIELESLYTPLELDGAGNSAEHGSAYS